MMIVVMMKVVIWHAHAGENAKHRHAGGLREGGVELGY